MRDWALASASETARAVATKVARKEVESLSSQQITKELPAILDTHFPRWFDSWARGSLAHFASAERVTLRHELRHDIDAHIAALASESSEAVSKPFFEKFHVDSNAALREFDKAATAEVKGIEQRISAQLQRVDATVDKRIVHHIGALETEVAVWRAVAIMATAAAAAAVARTYGYLGGVAPFGK